MMNMLIVAQFKGLGLPEVAVGNNTVPNILNFVFMIMGAISVVIIALAGMKYTMSMGEPSATKKAKDTILYAFIGLFASIMAVTLVTLVTNWLT